MNYSNFVITKSEKNSNTFLCYIIEEVDLPKENEKYFVLIPYNNPTSNKLNPRYFKYSFVEEKEFPANDLQTTLEFTCETSYNDYVNNVNAIKEEIKKGNIYELNYCINFKATAHIDIFTCFANLIKQSNAPYNFLFKYNNEVVICCSPELFIKKENNTLLTKPIKGTIKRGQDSLEDKKLKLALQNSFKDRIENVMAVDVARNDLSIIAMPKTVKVNALYNIESFKNVHQMVSTISCELANTITFKTIIDAMFPMASMTGAPKQSAMNLIDTFETFNRKYYSGTMGFMDSTNFELPVIIRSLFYNCENNNLNFCVGSAITHLSNANDEYNECVLKAQSMLKAVGGILQQR
ncbi:MAG: anthranilate synthase component I family protein [Bacteroidetes bacterium]|nr:anthranilate synthase component I family protein [Bacteroidota bacterium]